MLALYVSPAAQAQIYRCEGPNGVAEYSNTLPAGDTRRCRKVSLPSLTTIPAAKVPSVAKPAAPNGGAAFPRVDPRQQKVRDEQRREILESELRKEQQRLAGLKAEYKDGEPDRLGNERNYQKYLDRVARLKDEIGRSETNIASIERELAPLRH